MEKEIRAGVTIYTLRNGKEFTLGELSTYSGKSVGCLHHRMKKLGYTVDEAVEEPLDERKRGKLNKIDNKQLEQIEKENKIKSKLLRDKLVKIMSKPINPSKDAYLMLSLKAKSKNWLIRKEQQ